jgi:drug/metabolite transporter (DMT)-like permease
VPADDVSRTLGAALTSRPRAMAAAGAGTIAFSSILVRLAHVSPSTAAIFRCAYALPVLWLLSAREDRLLGRRSARQRRVAAASGVFFAADLLLWHHAIADVGAGLGTVLANLQVVLIPLVAWGVLREHPSRRVLATLPVVLAGILLVSGALEHGAYGRSPAEGTVFGVLAGLTYAAFLLLIRAGNADLRRVAGPLFDATAVATVVAVAAGLVVGDADLVPSWPAHGWLVTLALSSQVVGWLLLTSSLPRLPAAITSVLLTIQPVGSVLLAALIFGEAPSALQLAGVAAILVGLVTVAAPARSVRRAAPTPAVAAET